MILVSDRHFTSWQEGDRFFYEAGFTRKYFLCVEPCIVEGHTAVTVSEWQTKLLIESALQPFCTYQTNSESAVTNDF